MALVLKVHPSITGVAMPGGTLHGTWAGIEGAVAPVTNEEFWQRSAEGSGSWIQVGAGLTYEVTQADVSQYIRFRHQLTDSDGESIESFSAPIGPVSGEFVFFDCQLGSPTQTSYICVETADLLLQTVPSSPGVTEWLESTDTNAKKRLLNLASQILDSLCWLGDRCSCEQALEWPRLVNDCSCELARCSELPFDIQMATAYLAAYLATKKDFAWNPGGGSLVPEGSGGGGSGSIDTGNDAIAGLAPFEEVTVGPINVKMRADAEFVTGGIWGWEYLPPYIQSLLWKWLCSDGPGGRGSGNGANFTQGSVGRGSVARVREYMPNRVPGKFWLRNGKVAPRFGGWNY